MRTAGDSNGHLGSGMGMLRGRRGSEDRGSGSLLALLMTGLLVTVTSGALAVVQAVIAGQRADATADLAAIAAAGSLLDPCDAAAKVATANDAQLTSCRLDIGDVVITVSVDAPPVLAAWAGWAGRPVPRVTGSARAGPG